MSSKYKIILRELFTDLSKRSTSPATACISNKASIRSFSKGTFKGPLSVQKRCFSSSSDQSKIIHSSYPDVEIPDVAFTEFVFSHQEKYAKKIAMINGETGQAFTHLEIREYSKALGSAFSRLGFGKGEVVAIVSSNCPEYGMSFFGLCLAGVIPTTINYTFTANEIKHQLSNAECSGVICHSDKLSDVREAVRDMPNVRHILCIDKEVDGITSIQKLMKDDGKGLPILKKNSEDVLVMPYSSGTTGLPKGVLLTHRNIVANIQQILYDEVSFLDKSEDKNELFLGILPMYHIYGMVLNMAYALCVGASIVTMKEFETNAFVKNVKKYKPTMHFLVPPLVSFLECSKLVTPEMLEPAHSILCGAAPLGENLINKFVKKFGNNFQFLEGYGLTETSPVISVTPKGKFTLGSCGVLVPNTKLKVVDLETGALIGPNEGDGELLVSGPQVMKGYYKNDAATQASIDPDGWFHTGDIARIDENRNIFVVDRFKELIKVKGIQVAPAELENLLRDHPSVEDVAVIGIPDEISGERPKAFVVPSKGATPVTDLELMDFISERVAKHKRLKTVTFIGEIPKSASGKILRKDLKSF